MTILVIHSATFIRLLSAITYIYRVSQLQGTYRDKAKLPFKNSKRNRDTNFDAMEGDSLK